MADAARIAGEGVLARNPLGNVKDIFIAVGVILVVLMLIFPLPAPLLDFLMGLNLTFSLLVLLIVLYTQRPTEFSLFPTVLLVSTVFGLALNVSSTRLILRDGARFNGAMIQFFSSIVVGAEGSTGIVIGFIIFIVILAVQAVVITKGATRVSEVAARFTLDSMQVKMMAIETEYSSGSITEEESQRRKAQVQKESDFYGSMDGASKFISGNVKVGIFITVVNVLAGYIVGVVLHNEPWQNALSTYIRFSIGDGLLSQIPALLISTAMGIVVTRAAAVGNLSEQVTEQFSHSARIYWICAAVMLCFAPLLGGRFYVPVLISALLAFTAYQIGRKNQKAASFNEMMAKTKGKGGEDKPAEMSPVVPLDALSLELGYGLIPLVDKEKGAELLDRVQGVRRQSALDLGLVIPKVRIIDNMVLEPSEYCFKIKGVDVGRGKIRMGYFLCINPGTVGEELSGGEKTVDPAFGLPALWVSSDRRDEAERAGYTVVDPPSIIATHLTEIIKHHAADILGLQDTQAILDTLKKEYPAVVEEVLRENKGLRVVEIQKILQGLLRERVSIRNMVSILEAVADYAPVSKNIWFLTEKARQALASQICHQYADEDRKLRVLTIDPALEQKIIDSKYETPSGVVSALDPPSHHAWIKAVSRAASAVKEKGWLPVILCSEQARYLVKNSTDREMPELAIISVPEIVADIHPESVGVIRLENRE
jgi:flagellar biosynthesis protein FlhA